MREKKPPIYTTFTPVLKKKKNKYTAGNASGRLQICTAGNASGMGNFRIFFFHGYFYNFLIFSGYE